MKLGVFSINYAFTDVLNVSLRHLIYILNFFLKILAHFVDKFLLFFKSLVEDAFYLLI